MTKLILNGALLAIVFIISETYGDIYRTFTDEEVPSQQINKSNDLSLSTSSSLPSKSNLLKPAACQTLNSNSPRERLNRSTFPSFNPNSFGWSSNLRKSFMDQFNNIQWSPTNQDEYLNQMVTNLNQFRDNGKNMYKSASFRKCCINGNCRMLQEGEKCFNEEDLIRYNKDKEQLTSKKQSFTKPYYLSELSGVQTYSNGNQNGNGFDSNVYNTMDSNSKRPSKNYSYVTPNGVSKKNINNIRKEVLDRSNYYRNKYGIESLVLDEQMNNYAQDWANKLVNIGGLNHRKGNVYGENLYSSTGYENFGKIAVDNWYNEIVDYNLNDDENQLHNNDAIHHMTQLLWKSSKKLGVGVSKDRNNKYYIVANYEPIGNMKGLYKQNLPEITQSDIDEAVKLENSQNQPDSPAIWNSRWQ